jgi:hypothetical protein
VVRGPGCGGVTSVSKVLRVLVMLVAAGLVTAAGFAIPAAAAGYDLRGTAVVEGGPHLPGDQVTVKYTVTNAGDIGVYYAHGHDQGSFAVESGWGDLGEPAGASFAPGESRDYLLSGHVGGTSGQVQLSVLLDGVSSPLALTEVTIPVATGSVTVTGQVFADADEDGVAGPGEGLAGAHVALSGYIVDETRTTGADGRFSFADLPPRTYGVYVPDAPDGWLVLGGVRELRLDGSVPVVDVPLRAVRPLAETVHANLTLDRETYEVGDSAVVAVSLANTGSRPVTGVFAACDGVGYGRDLEITPAGWGELAYGGPGATIQPGETRTFRVPGTVRDVSGSWGFLEEYCDFPRDEDFSGSPRGADTAKVTGRDGTSTGRIVTETGEGLAGAEVTATDADTGAVVTATTEADGRLTVTGPAGRYRLSVPGPWVLSGYQPVYVVAAPRNGDGWVLTRQPA